MSKMSVVHEDGLYEYIFNNSFEPADNLVTVIMMEDYKVYCRFGHEELAKKIRKEVIKDGDTYRHGIWYTRKD